MTARGRSAAWLLGLGLLSRAGVAPGEEPEAPFVAAEGHADSSGRPAGRSPRAPSAPVRTGLPVAAPGAVPFHPPPPPTGVTAPTAPAPTVPPELVAPRRVRGSLEVAGAARLELTVSAEVGYDDNVRLLAPVEAVTGVPLKDGFAGASVGLQRDVSADGAVAWVDASFRRFFTEDDGALGAVSGHLGWRWRLGPLRLEPAVEATAFAWSVFPSDAHVALAFAPELGATRGRLSVTLVPSVVARLFGTGTDGEGWGRAFATLRFTSFDLTASVLGGKVSSATPELSRTLVRADVGVAFRVLDAVVLGLRGSVASKALPAFPSPSDGGPAGRRDLIPSGRAYARWSVAPSLAVVGAVDALESWSDRAVGDYRRLAGTLSLEWRWEPTPWRRARNLAPREVTFQVDAPQAADVQLAGSFLGWEPLPMARSAAGTWQVTTPVEPGSHRFGYLVDGVWALPDRGPRAADGLGGEDAQLSVGGD